ncbi:WD40 repeat domain-containing protein [Anatilimnocola sp. NA78]|uniref:WD40 repeat domain-containing protein n=1 Tax=Anatilimnocola sp. NA78 TaxID=3415683 RepID=UPI003CE49249
MTSTRMGVLVFGLLVFCVPVAIVAQEDPFAGKPAAIAKAASLLNGLSIPGLNAKSVTFGGPGCPVVLISNRIHEISTGKAVCSLTVPDLLFRMGALSGDGKYVAVCNRMSQEGEKILVFNAQTGESVMEIPKASARDTLLVFSFNKYLIANSTDNNSLDVWDLETKAKKKSIPLAGQRIEWEKVSFSGDGRSFCMVGDEGPVVCDTATGKVQAQLSLAAPVTVAKGNRGLPNPRAGQPNPSARQAMMAARFALAWTKSLSFSPDSDEIACFTTHPHPRLICWSRQGKMLLDIPIPESRDQTPIVWLPEKTGWLVNQMIVDRTSKRAVMKLGRDASAVALSKDQLFGLFGEAGSLDTFTIPWEDLRKSLKAMASRTPAILAPYQAVSIEVKVDQARGDIAELTKVVTEAVTKRLERDGVAVKPGQPTTFRITVSEKAGELLPIYERTSRFDFQGRDTGNKATEANGTASVEIIAAGEAEPIWRDVLKSTNSTSFKKEINDATVRESMLENLGLQLNRLNLPYFIPKAEDLLALPVMVQ